MARLTTPPEQVRCRRLVLAADSRLDDIVRRLVDAFRPERVYLFGSRARGEGGPDSDCDLLVVGSMPADDARRTDAIQSPRP
jgi:predicted nucleotidyltransferase